MIMLQVFVLYFQLVSIIKLPCIPFYNLKDSIILVLNKILKNAIHYLPFMSIIGLDFIIRKGNRNGTGS